jgi:hypothetical protein
MLFPMHHALIPCIGTALIILTGKKAVSRILLSNPVTVGIGLISYSVYLVHWPMIVFWKHLDQSLGWTDQALIVFCTLALGYLSYRYIETPFRTKKIDLASPRYRNAFISISIVVFATGIHISNTNGWEWRVSTPLKLDHAGNAAMFHINFYGGSGYPRYEAIDNRKPPNVILMGDSHGRHYAEGITKIFTNPNKLNLYMASGTSCLHLPGFTRITPGRDWNTLCPNALNKALSLIEQGDKPLVIISHSWLSQMSIAALLNAKNKKVNDHITPEDLIDGILKLKERIGESPLVVIGAVPGTGDVLLYDVLSRPSLPFLSNAKPEQYLTTPANTKTIEFNAQLKKAAEKTGDFYFLDPHDALCDLGQCLNLDANGQLIYSDKAHLSKFGSIAVISEFYPDLIAIYKTNNPRYQGAHTVAN